jgi:hypothetical protein
VCSILEARTWHIVDVLISWVSNARVSRNLRAKSYNVFCSLKR